MLIDDKREGMILTVVEMMPGCVFEKCDELYIVTDERKPGDKLIGCVDLQDGALVWFDYDAEVEALGAKVVVGA